MISKTLIDQASEFAKSQAEQYGLPSVFHLELTNRKGQWLADELGADKNIVLLGTNLMDCLLGVAYKEGKLSEHTTMSAEKTNDFLSNFSEVTDEEKQNVIQCVLQHHGGVTFYSIESEICCNADCYRFASVEGVLGGTKNSRSMPLANMVKFYQDKADEKFNALTLSICKDELTPQYKAIKQFLDNY